MNKPSPSPLHPDTARYTLADLRRRVRILDVPYAVKLVALEAISRMAGETGEQEKGAAPDLPALPPITQR